MKLMKQESGQIEIAEVEIAWFSWSDENGWYTSFAYMSKPPDDCPTDVGGFGLTAEASLNDLIRKLRGFLGSTKVKR